MVFYEYYSEFGIVSTYRLNQLGKEGWELITVELHEAKSLRRYIFKKIKL
jgi:hypothetical protein